MAAGSYNLRIEDENFCSFDTTLIIGQPQPLDFDTTLSHVKCYGDATGAITVHATGGNGGYKYYRDGFSSYFTDNHTSSLTAGTYQIRLMDNKFCKVEKAIIVSEPLPLALTENTPTDNNCHGVATGAVGVVVSGGTSPYVYSWKKDGVSSFAENNDSPTLTGLGGGEYQVSVTDDYACPSITSSTMEVKEPNLPLTVNYKETHISCFCLLYTSPSPRDA